MLSLYELSILRELRDDPGWYSDEEDPTREQLEYEFAITNYGRFTKNPARGQFNPNNWGDKWDFYDWNQTEKNLERFDQFLIKYRRVQASRSDIENWPLLQGWSRFERRRKQKKLVSQYGYLHAAPVIAGEILRHFFKPKARKLIRIRERISVMKLALLVTTNEYISPLAYLHPNILRFICEFL